VRARAQRLKRLFGIEVETCSDFGRAVRSDACIEDAEGIEKILTTQRAHCGIRPHFPVVKFAQERGEYSPVLTSPAQLALHNYRFQKDKTGWHGLCRLQVKRAALSPHVDLQHRDHLAPEYRK
jgi:hypothetical protein